MSIAVRAPTISGSTIWKRVRSSTPTRFRRRVGPLHAADPQRPLGGDAWDGFRAYSLSLDLVGVHRWPLMTGLELSGYRDWLNQRRLLARRRMLTWTWVQTHLPDWYTNLVYDKPGSA